MEGSAALGAGGQQAGGADGGQGAEQQQAGGQFDPSQLVASMSAIAEGQNETRELLRSLAEQNTAGAEGAEGEEGDGHDPFAGLDLSFLEETPAAAEAEDPAQFTAQLGQVLAQAVQQGVQQQMGQIVQPLQTQLSEMQRSQAAQELADEFPALADPGTAQEVMGLASQLAAANGQPELGDQPWFWRLTYMAAEAAAAANDAGGNADPNAATLEGGGGALPGGASGGDLGDAIVGSRRGASVLPTF